MTDALTTALEELAGNPRVRVVVLTGGAPGYFIRHYSIASLLRFAEAVRSSGREGRHQCLLRELLESILPG